MKNKMHEFAGQYSRGSKRDRLNGTNRAELAVFHRFSLIFADSWELQHFRGEDFCRKPQDTADFRRNPFVPLVCPFEFAGRYASEVSGDDLRAPRTSRTS